ncbi:cyclin-domain-containing protein [Parathielavia appendiculata]|uniref:Cyclin-domain-containing protein n=1 Tax=Parathielavia appendiculata TaxID=2587402 RepID=A0AAN6YYD7_9PEZI|nr:cyclin-domain-containing protein [Parathielavia appendiculata]
MAEGEPRPEALTLEPHAASGSGPSPVRTPPPPPIPSTDPRLQAATAPDVQVPSPTLAARVDDIFKVSPQAALSLFSTGVEALVNMTGDVPPTPPPRSPTLPHMRGMEAEKQSIVRSNSEKSLARLAQRASAATSPLPGRSPRQNVNSASQPAPGQPAVPTAGTQAQSIDGVHLRVPNPALQAAPSISVGSPQPLSPYIIVGENSQPLNLQHSAITRKFYCRVPPPISVTDYLLRIHRYCPMSTAVYLAASLYIHRLAVLERAIVVTRRNVHRLLLAGLRVAMKALEDLSYPHARFARVGGISEKELARLEISFCFLTGFELAVDVPKLSQHWDLLRRGAECWNFLDQGTHQGTFVQLREPTSGNSGVRAQA